MNIVHQGPSNPHSTHGNSQIYANLPIDTDDGIRLLQIRPGKPGDVICCHIYNARLQDAPEYESLSYTWGGVEKTRKTQCQDVTGSEIGHIMITENCYSALEVLRQEKTPRTLWVDAICIDQYKTEERNQQLGLMNQIYQQAKEVAIYLGESENESDKAMEWISEIDAPVGFTDYANYLAACSAQKREIGRPDTQILENFFRRAWFNRIWVLQEIAFAQSITVYCGSKSIPGSAFETFKDWNNNEKWVKSLPYVIQSLKFPTREEPDEVSLFRKLLATRHCQSTDPRDKLYALLPMVAGQDMWIKLAPDYKLSPVQVFVRLARYLMNRLGLLVLEEVASVAHSKLEKLPSWVPDWSATSTGGVYTQYTFRARRISSFTTTVRDLPPPCHWEILTNESEQCQLRCRALKFSTLRLVGDPCNVDRNCFPISQWLSLVDQEDLVPAGPRVEPRHGNDILTAQSELGSFQRTLVMDDVIYAEAIKRGLQKLVEYDLQQSPKGDIRASLESLPPTNCQQANRMLEYCDGRVFFVLENDSLGLAPTGTKVGDVVYILAGAAVPFVVREHIDGARLIGPCYVQGIMQDEAMAGIDVNKMASLVIT